MGFSFQKMLQCSRISPWLIFTRYRYNDNFSASSLNIRRHQRVCELCYIAVGAKIGYFTGDPLKLLEDAQILRPHFFPSVPRVLNRVYQAAMAAGDVPGLRGNIFRKAVSAKLEKFRRTGDPTHPLWDRLVFRKVWNDRTEKISA